MWRKRNEQLSEEKVDTMKLVQEGEQKISSLEDDIE